VQVTRQSFKHALQTEKHVAVCPGGQAELLYCSDVFSSEPMVNLCTRHKGFCRLAVELDAAVVPVINFGEVFQLRNAMTWRWLQRLSYKWIGFPVPYLLQGYWGSPIGRRSPSRFAAAPLRKPRWQAKNKLTLQCHAGLLWVSLCGPVLNGKA
jgi:diacylglycerol O-acyltransferase 2, plant